MHLADWLSPCTDTRFKIVLPLSPRRTNQVADSNGNPLVVSAVITFKVVSPSKAALDVPDYVEYLRNQGLTVMKRVVSMHPYEAPQGHHSLKTEAAHVREMMVQCACVSRRQRVG